MYSTTSLRRQAGQERGAGGEKGEVCFAGFFTARYLLRPARSPASLPGALLSRRAPESRAESPAPGRRVPGRAATCLAPQLGTLASAERVYTACRNTHTPELAANPPRVLGGREGATRCPQPPKACAASARQPSGRRATQAAGAGGDGQRIGHQKEKQRKEKYAMARGLGSLFLNTGLLPK